MKSYLLNLIWIIAISGETVLCQINPEISGIQFIYLNPIRCITDEPGIYYENQFSEKHSFGISLGYSMQNRFLANQIRYHIFHFENLHTRFLCHGPVLKLQFNYQTRVADNQLMFISYGFQFRHYEGDLAYIHTAWNADTIYNYSRITNMFGPQILAGTKILPAGKDFFFEYYMGLGFNIQNYRTIYHSYQLEDGTLVNKDIPEILEDAEGIRIKPTFHAGLRIGFWFFRNKGKD